ncbi:BNR/Asp-box repeat protein [Pseudomonas sp. GM21]|uniref:WD40/YVTN/BNR-like repeat-containing protein n=1 Tax=Pseudomonas sp. GM21 TaxID=1144325 RepID=UPI00027258FF|nr:YCF48-related protein [Pseudomonas sp. GM21]EJM22903.1 BNR/Asp-box repeat protein [Pseudomonas sp. GM21]
MKRIRQRCSLLLAVALSLSAQWGVAQTAAVVSPLGTPAMHVAPSQKTVLLDLARAGARLVAVGERGIVMLSDDNGQSWRQADVPVSVTLSAVQFVNDRQGWAVGHAGVVLATTDAGEHWTLQLDGTRAAQIELTAARNEQAAATDASAAEARIASAERLVADGPDKPFLAMKFVDAQRGLIVGAFGLAMQTVDGGATWTSTMGHIDNPMNLHMYAISQQGQRWFVAGEQGFLARSDDDGASFAQLESPYGGSLFTAQSRSDGALLVAGLKGNAFISHDAGDTFQPLNVGLPISFSDSVVLASGQVLFANQGGGLYVSDGRSGDALRALTKPLGLPVAGVIQADDGSLIVAGFSGLTRVPLPANVVSE